MTVRRLRWLSLAVLILGACQHAGEAQAAEPKSTPAAPEPITPAPSNEAPAPEAPKGLPDKVAAAAAAKTLASLQACSLQTTGRFVKGQLTLVTQECSRRTCIRTCCNTCKFVAMISGSGPQRGLNAAQVHQLFPAFPLEPLECEINEWNKQLKPLTIGLSVPPEKSPESSWGPVTACLSGAER